MQYADCSFNSQSVIGLTSFVILWTASFGQSRRGGYIVLAAWAGLRAMPVTHFPLPVSYMCIFCLGILPFFQGSLG